MIGVQVSEEDLVEEIVGDHQCGDIDHRASAYIEKELVAVAGFDQPAGSGLVTSCGRQTGAAGEKANLIFPQLFGARKVDITVRRGAGRRGDNTASAQRHGRA